MEFSKRKIIINSWNTLKNHLGLWMLIMLLVFCLNLVLGTIQDALLDEINYQSILFIIAAYLFQMGLHLGMLRITLNIINNSHLSQVVSTNFIIKIIIIAPMTIWKKTDLMVPRIKSRSAPSAPKKTTISSINFFMIISSSFSFR
mgnify:CR=1 FL=1